MKTKTWLWIVVSVLAAAGAVWWLWRPQTITLDDGTKLKLVAVTYGKLHNFPGEQHQSLAFESTNDTLAVWIEQKHTTNDWPNYQIYACDKSATACVGAYSQNARQLRRGGEGMVGILLDAFPRRQGKFYLRVLEWNPQNGRQTIKNGFVISNPARGHFPAWFPDPLPNTQVDDDLSVTLTRLEFGAKSPFTRNPNAKNDPMNKGVLAAFHIQQNGADVIQVSRKYFSMHGSYGIQILPGFDVPMALAIVVALEQIEVEEGRGEGVHLGLGGLTS